MRKLWVVISLVGLFGCSTPDYQSSDIIVLGHAGAGFPSINNHYPINSEESITQALFVHGADGVEVDIQLSTDSQFVLFHDTRLESGANDTGFISDKNWESLKSLTRRDSRTALHDDVVMWRLEDLLNLIDSLGLDIYLSLNIQNQYEVTDQSAYNALLVRQLGNLFAHYTGVTKTIVETRDHDCIVALKDLPQQWGIQLFFTGSLSQLNIERNASYVDGFVTNYLDETESSIQNIRVLGKKVALYGVKIRQDIAPALKFKPDYIQTDNIPLTLSYLDR
ncbi:MAG: glycerophosphoryl diester phosphodiesterase [bacterium]